jgi:hypothetical protein
MRLIRSSKTPEELEFERRQRDLDEQIAQLEGIPEQLELEIQESDQTLPPPDDLNERDRQRSFDAQVARGQVRNERRTQGRSLLLMVLLIAAITSVASWVLRLAQG